jgi:Holliday junction resolvase RusA-like endonuclease
MTRNGHVYTPALTQRAEDAVRAAWEGSGRIRLPHAPICVELTAAFSRPASHYLRGGKLSAAGRRAIPGRVDLDNVWKLVIDALNRLAWTDDRLITQAILSKEWARHGEPERLRLLAWCPDRDDVARPV